MKKTILVACVGLAITGPAVAQEYVDGAIVDYDIIPKALADEAVLLRERALLNNLSVDLVESITTEVGPRRAGTEGDRRAIAWALAKFEELGFDRAWAEEFTVE
ncbi:MAG: hypothetical protein VYD01_09105, partial [Pseudomonadota bacterium]|nr:hypothetical protein [Pseudomonadota bacterium]